MLDTVMLSSDYVKLLRSLARVYPFTVLRMKDDDKKKDDDRKKDSLYLSLCMKAFVLPVNWILSPSLSTVSRQENVHIMQDDDKRRDDDKKKDSLCKIGRLRKCLGHGSHCCALVRPRESFTKPGDGISGESSDNEGR